MSKQNRRGAESVCLRSVLRQPVRSLILLLLIAAAAFASFSQALQYAVLSRATREIGGYYRAIGTLSSDDPDTVYDIAGCMDALQSSEYVDFIDKRRTATFTMQDVYAADIYGWTAAYMDVYVCGEVASAEIEVAQEVVEQPAFSPEYVSQFEQSLPYDTSEYIETAYRLCIQMDVAQTLAGLPEYAPTGRKVMYLFSDDLAMLETMAQALESGPRVFLRAQINPEREMSQYMYQVLPLDGEALYYYDLGGRETPDFDDPALTGVQDAMELLEENARTSYLWTTKDMTAIPNLDEHYLLSDGRLLNYDDEAQQNAVCVIRQELAALRGLSIGDTLTIKLRDLPYSAGSIRPGMLDEPWQQAESCTRTLTIVGLLTAAGEIEQNPNEFTRIYVPDWVVPEHYDVYSGMVVADYTSFVLKDIRDEDAFTKQTAESFAGQGFHLRFEPTGYEGFAAAAEPLLESTRTNLWLFAAAGALTLALAVALYLFFRRKELPILRALGVRRSGVMGAALVPAALLSAVGFAAAGVGAYRYGMQKAVETLAGFQSEYVITPRFSSWEMAALAAGVWLVMNLAVLAALAVITRRPVLEQLQSGAQRPAAKKQAEPAQALQTQATAAAQASGTKPASAQHKPAAPHKTHAGFGWSVRWLGRRLARTPGKVVLAMAVAAGLLVGLGALGGSITTGQTDVDRMYDTIEVTGQVLRKDSLGSLPGGAFLPADAAQELEAIGQLRDVVREAGCEVTCMRLPEENDAQAGKQQSEAGQSKTFVQEASGQQLWAIQRPETFAPLRDGTLQITYAGVMNEEAFFSNATGQPELVVSEQTLATLGLEPGESMYVSWGNTGLVVQIVGSFSASFEETGFHILMSYDALAQMFEDELKNSEQKLTLRRFEFTVDKALNRQMTDVREQFGAVLENCGAPAALLLQLSDSELTQVVEPLERNLRLMRVLYPLFRALSVLLAAAVSALLVLQSAKEASILRVLGVRRGRTASLLVLEQLIPALLGLLVGAVALRFAPIGGVAWNEVWQNAAGYALGSLIGAAVSALARVQKNPLELLQVKE